MSWIRCGLALLLVLFISLPSTTAKSTVSVDIPPSLRAEFPEGVFHRPAMFGHPDYFEEQGISGWVVYATPGDLDGCAPLVRPSTWPEGRLIILVDRGNCSFVAKVRNVQAALGSAAIVVDNTDWDELPYMAEDGSPSLPTIPSVIIRKRDGLKIKEAIAGGAQNSSFVRMTLKWSLPAPDNRVEVEFWTSSVDEAGRAAKAQYGRVAELLGDRALFFPSFWIFDGRGWCTAPSLPCGNQCTNEGRYCEPDPDRDLRSGVSGADVVTENLYQLCLWNVLNATGQPNQWWKYVDYFDSTCYPPGNKIKRFDATCRAEGVARTGAKMADVEKCVTESGGLSGVNKILEDELAYARSRGAWSYPMVMVNEEPFRGDIQCPGPKVDIESCSILGMICAGYERGTAPTEVCGGDLGCDLGVKRDCRNECGGGRIYDACQDCRHPKEQGFNQTCAGCDGIPYSGKAVDACGVCGGDGKCISPSGKGVSVGAIVGIVAASSIVVGAGVFLYMRRQKTVLRDDIDSLLRQYLPLEAANSLAHTQDVERDRLTHPPPVASDL